MAIYSHSVHLSDEEKPSTINFSQRPLWVKAQKQLSIIENISLGIPPFFSVDDLENPTSSQAVHNLCQRLNELGYTAVVFGSRIEDPPCPSIEEKISPLPLFQALQNQGIQVIIKPTLNLEGCLCSPYHPSFRHQIHTLHPLLKEWGTAIDAFFWESCCEDTQYHAPLEAREKMAEEVILEELHLLEKVSADTTDLIFYLPVTEGISQQEISWLPEFCDEAGVRTTIAFSALAGDPTHSYLPAHPYWSELRRHFFCPATPLMPIMNAGNVGMGAGLWPMLSVELFDQYLQRMVGFPFSGAIAMTEFLPKQGGLLDCSLWVFGQMLSQGISADLLAETWFSEHRVNWDYTLVRPLLREMYRLGQMTAEMWMSVREKSIKQQHPDAIRARVDCLLALLADLQQQMRGLKIQDPSLSNYFLYFARDVRGIVQAFLRQQQIPLSRTFEPKDLQPAFWTRMESEGQQMVGAVPSITFLDQPERGEEGSPMEQIFLENSLFC